MPAATNSYQSRSLEWLGIGLLCLLWSLSTYSWFQLPETIPTHFNFNGEVDRYGSKLTLWLLPAIATMVYVGLTALCRVPQIFNYPVTITDENREFQYQNAVRMLEYLKLVIVALFTLVNWIIYQAATGKLTRSAPWLLPVILVVVGLPTVIGIIRAVRHKGAASKR